MRSGKGRLPLPRRTGGITLRQRKTALLLVQLTNLGLILVACAIAALMLYGLCR